MLRRTGRQRRQLFFRSLDRCERAVVPELFEVGEPGSNQRGCCSVERLQWRGVAPLRGVDDPAEDLERFKDLVDGAFVF